MSCIKELVARIIVALVILTLGGTVLVAEEQQTLPPIAWKLTEGFEKPESAYFDKESGDLFLSQIVGEGGKKDGEGYITRLTIDGKLIKQKWFDGLNAPKGLRSHNGVLWISDIDHIVAVRIKDAKKIADVQIPQAKFLNDLAIGPDGTVYVADMIASKIYQYKDESLSVFDEGEKIESPNGLLVDGNRLIVGAWGYCDDFNPETPGRLFWIDIKTKEKHLITKEPTGNLDGVELDGKGGYYVSDWAAGKVFHIDGDGETKVIMQFGKGTADLAYLVEKKLLILPQMLDGTLTAFEISP